MYEVINLDAGESHGEYDSHGEARGAVGFDRLEAYEIWDNERGVRVEHCEPYHGDDDRVRQALGQCFGEQPS